MLRNISDIIEQHIKNIIRASEQGYIDIQRSELAYQFECVPSQINYVISTRFTLEKGYVVESKRGGGGYIRIRKVDLDSTGAALQIATRLAGAQISQREAEDVIHRLFEEGMITEREARMLIAACDKNVLQYQLPERDRLRAAILHAMLLVILKG